MSACENYLMRTGCTSLLFCAHLSMLIPYSYRDIKPAAQTSGRNKRNFLNNHPHFVCISLRTKKHKSTIDTWLAIRPTNSASFPYRHNNGGTHGESSVPRLNAYTNNQGTNNLSLYKGTLYWPQSERVQDYLYKKSVSQFVKR